MDAVVAELRLKNMTAWTCAPELSQEDIDMLLVLARRADADGRSVAETGWVPTFHLEWAAAEAWAWKAAFTSGRFDVMDSGVKLQLAQVHNHAVEMFKLYAKKASNQPRSIRSSGNLVVDRLSAATPYPWWWASGSQ